MIRLMTTAILIAFSVIAVAADDELNISLKDAAASSIDSQGEALIELSDQVWAHAEIALEETRSGQALADYAEQHGFRVERGIAGMPMAFIASYGKGKPIIGILGEYDALPGLSQTATPTKNVLVDGAAGHGCGHNLFGVGSAVWESPDMSKHAYQGTDENIPDYYKKLGEAYE